ASELGLWLRSSFDGIGPIGAPEATRSVMSPPPLPLELQELTAATPVTANPAVAVNFKKARREGCPSNGPRPDFAVTGVSMMWSSSLSRRPDDLDELGAVAAP